MSNAWSRALDAIEFHLTLIQAALAAGIPAPPAQNPELPTDPLPAELAERARALVTLTQQLESTAQARLDRLQAALRSIPARRVNVPRPRTGTFVDVGA